LTDPLYADKPAVYDVRKFIWIGAMNDDSSICYTHGKSRIRNLAYAQAFEATMASTGVLAESSKFPIALNATVGTRFKVITGYSGTANTLLAVERGETEGRCTTVGSINATQPGAIQKRTINMLVQIGLRKRADLLDIPLALDLAAPEEQHLARVFSDVDAALEWCEDQLLADSPYNVSQPKFAISEIDLFRGLTPEECRLVEGIVQPLQFEKGDVIIREGAEANLLFVLARGKVSVQIRVPGQGGRRKRVASIGTGLSFGEMALLDGGKRSADIVADERAVCYGFSVEALREVGKTNPNLMMTIMGNMMRDFSERLRRANDEIRALEQ
jgi:hypothetical protein